MKIILILKSHMDICSKDFIRNVHIVIDYGSVCRNVDLWYLTLV